MWSRHALSAVVLLAPLVGGAVGGRTAPSPERQGDSMRVELVVPPKVGIGRPVPIALRIRNTQERPINLYLQGRPVAFDLIIEQAGGAEVWRRLQGAAVSAILGVRTLAPGEVFELKETWKQTTQAGRPAGPGAYRVTGLVLTDGEPLRAGPVPFRIE